MNISDSPFVNYLIDALPSAVKARLLPYLKLIELPAGKILYDVHEWERFAFFPVNCLISLTYGAQSGTSSKISLVGREGMVGIFAVLDGESSTSRSIVLSGGYAYQVPSQLLRDELISCVEFRDLILHYTQALLTQVAQTVVCNRHCHLDQRLCSLLLLSLDRLPSNHLTMTQELIANMLGVRREGVTEAASQLQKLGVIEYRRGHITVLDRNELEQRCCECYFAITNETNRLLPGIGSRLPRIYWRPGNQIRSKNRGRTKLNS